jgi:hypothetical protein
MSRIAFTGNALGTGTVTMAAPNTNTDQTVTLPNQTGTLYISGGDIGTPSGGNGSNLTNLNASNLATGTVPDARFPATLPAASGVNLTALNASNLGSGTVPTARLATSGTASSTTFLRGDQTWATAGGAPAALGDIGTVMWAIVDTTSVIFPGSTVAGSSCYYPTAFSFNNGSIVQTEGGATSSNPRQEYRVAQTSSGVGRANRIRSGNVGYSFSTTNLAALSGTWRVLFPVLARTSSYDACNNITEAQTNATLIQRIS